MKRIFTYLTGFSLLTITTVSCSKDVNDETRQQATAAPQVISANVSAGQTYVLTLGMTSASIVTQALHYQLSQVATASDGSTVYKYTALKDYAGADEVTLQQTITYKSQGGGCHNNQMNASSSTTFKTIVLKLNVAN